MEQDVGDPNRPDIAARLAALRREAYSRSGTEASYAALRLLEEQVAASRVVTTPPALPTATSPGPSVTAPAGVTVAPPTTGHAAPWRRVGMIIVAAVVIAAVGYSFGRVPPAPTSTSTPSLPTDSQHGSATLALLETAQRPADVPPFSLGSDIVPGSVHILPTGLKGEVTIYGARTFQQLVCLVAVTAGPTSSQLGDSATTCASVHEFVTDGIRLRVTTNELVTDQAGFSNFTYFQYLWTGNGEITYISNHYQFPANPNF